MSAIFLVSIAGNYSVGSNIVIDGGESVRGIQRAFYAKIFPDMVNLEKWTSQKWYKNLQVWNSDPLSADTIIEGFINGD